MRLNKYEKNMMRAQKRLSGLSGKGIYVFRNNTSGDLFLPRKTKSGVTRVAIGQEFQGDDYYMYMVHNNELRLVRTIQTPEQQQQSLHEATEQAMDHKLITEQPPVVTTEGTVEYVQKQEQNQKPLNENRPHANNASPEVLLNENPLEGVEII